MGWGASAARSSSRTSASRTVRPEPAIPKISKDFCIGDSAAYRPDALSENLAPTAFADCESLVTVRQPTALADCESVARRLDGFGSAITAYAIISFSQGADGEFHSMPKPLLADCDTSPARGASGRAAAPRIERCSGPPCNRADWRPQRLVVIRQPTLFGPGSRRGS